ncbi:hypothetical protein BGX38DRAFT_1221560 [Terfezia claveryi]|nr:hypothetical protein BGX38DRAFT_1221560 [Terfezia claveryi]
MMSSTPASLIIPALALFCDSVFSLLEAAAIISGAAGDWGNAINKRYVGNILLGSGGTSEASTGAQQICSNMPTGADGKTRSGQ